MNDCSRRIRTSVLTAGICAAMAAAGIFLAAVPAFATAGSGMLTWGNAGETQAQAETEVPPEEEADASSWPFEELEVGTFGAFEEEIPASEDLRETETAEEVSEDQDMVSDEEAVEIQMQLAKEGTLESLTENFEKLGIVNISSGYLNVRKTRGKDGKVIGKMVGNDVCDIKKKKGKWYYIESGPVTGWVHKKYILTGDEAKEAAIAAMKNLKVTIETETLNVRTEPSEEAEIWDMLDQSEKYDVVESLGDWIEIEVDNESTGFVSADYVTLGYSLGRAIEFEEEEEKSTRQEIVDYAMQFIGNPYVWGGESLTGGCDCSGFTMLVYRHFGVSLTHYSVDQSREGTRVSEEDMKPGDLIFYARGGTINHVTMYIGNGKCVGAQSRRAGIQVRSWNYRTPVRIVNVLD